MFFIVQLFVRNFYFIDIKVIKYLVLFMYAVFAGISSPLSSFSIKIFLFFDAFMLFYVMMLFRSFIIRFFYTWCRQKVKDFL